MAGTKIGGYNARDTNFAKYGQDFYGTIGAIGGRNGHTGGFAANKALAALAGRLGGTISRKGAKMPQTERTKVTEAFKLKRDAYLDEIYREQRTKLADLAKKYGNGVRR